MGQAHDFKAGGLLLWVGIYVTVNLVGVAGAYLNRVYMKTLSNRIAKRIRDEVFEHVQTLPVSYFDHLPAGKVVSRITSDTESVRVKLLREWDFDAFQYDCDVGRCLYNHFLIKRNARTRIIIPSSCDDSMAENRCYEAEKILFRKS